VVSKIKTLCPFTSKSYKELDLKELSRAGRILRKVFEGKGSDVSKFKESNEMAPMAYKWDYDKSKLKLGLKGKVGLDKYYVKLPIHPTSRLERLDVEVWASKVEQRYLIGFWETDSDFRIMCELKGSVYKDVEPHGYINPIQTNEVKTESRMRAEGFASTGEKYRPLSKQDMPGYRIQQLPPEEREVLATATSGDFSWRGFK
jgi:hypothetical protein